MKNERPVLDSVNLVVKDMDAALKFYELLGLEIADTDPAWQAHHRKAVMPDGLDLDFEQLSEMLHRKPPSLSDGCPSSGACELAAHSHNGTEDLDVPITKLLAVVPTHLFGYQADVA